jgi:hypothetical protein
MYNCKFLLTNNYTLSKKSYISHLMSSIFHYIWFPLYRAPTFMQLLLRNIIKPTLWKNTYLTPVVILYISIELNITTTDNHKVLVLTTIITHLLFWQSLEYTQCKLTCQSPKKITCCRMFTLYNK